MRAVGNWKRIAAASLVLVAAFMTKPLRAEERWVATWGCAPQLVEPRNRPPSPGLSGNALRQMIHASIGGHRLRVRFSNAFGDGPLTITSARLAETALAFNAAASVTIPPREAVWSDPVDFTLAPLADLPVTIHFGDVPSAVTGHPGSRTTSYLGDAVKTEHWYILTGIDVATDDAAAAVVVLGDSITDGRGSTTDANNRWPDYLARRCFTNVATARVSVVNEGIGGNAVLAGGLGPAALKRFDLDALGQSGAHWLIVFEGVNDIGASRDSFVADRLIHAYGDFVNKAHAKGLRIYGATITPFGHSMYSSPQHESARQTVNDWIRTGGRFDAVIDFDTAVRDPSNPASLLPAYDTGDHLHLNPSGYDAMAQAVNLKLFEASSSR